MGFFWWLILGAEIFWVVVGTPRDFFDFCIAPIRSSPGITFLHFPRPFYPSRLLKKRLYRVLV